MNPGEARGIPGAGEAERVEWMQRGAWEGQLHAQRAAQRARERRRLRRVFSFSQGSGEPVGQEWPAPPAAWRYGPAARKERDGGDEGGFLDIQVLS
ncbi:MAG: hypothetical protein QJR00_02115 [Bacillota bacterium]|nr:hypothetical protein [Bacillota bacterium]